MNPAYLLTVNGHDILAGEHKRLMSLSLDDRRGFEADQLTITLDDADGKLSFPPRGAEITLKLGWQGQPLVDRGIFIVDETEHSGPPDQLTMVARSADFRGSLKAQHTQAYDSTTVGAIIEIIAARQNLTPAIGTALKPITIAHIDQTDESDASFLTRLSADYGAIATIKSGHLLFIKPGTGKTASGIELPLAELTRNMGDAHQYRAGDRQSRYTGVKAKWRDVKASKNKVEKVGNDGYMRTLKRVRATQQEAQQAAQAEWEKLQRGGIEFEITLAAGQADLMPDQPAKLTGWKKEIDEQSWIISGLTHTLDSGGYTTALKLEVKR